MFDQYLGFGWLLLFAFIYINLLFALTSSMDLPPGVLKREKTPEGIEPNWEKNGERDAVGKIKFRKPHTSEPVTHHAR